MNSLIYIYTEFIAKSTFRFNVQNEINKGLFQKSDKY